MKVISKKNLPTRAPIASTVLYSTALSYWKAPGWAWGALGLIMIIFWIVWIFAITYEESVEIFVDKDTSKSKQ